MGNKLVNEFKKIFNCENESVFFALGRINLIGEHTDYNGGHVFPCAISLGTYGLVKKRKDKILRLYSLNFPAQGIFEIHLDDLNFRKEDNWTNYVKGMIQALIENGAIVKQGLDILFYGNLPNGAGLSSSASIELLTGIIMKEEFELKETLLELARLGQKVENNYIGLNSGIMDQFAVALSKENTAIFLNCSTLKYEQIPVELHDYVIVIMNTNKRRELTDSKYNERRRECEQAVKELRPFVKKLNFLGDLTATEFEKIKRNIDKETIIKRAKHAVLENQRTHEAKEALLKNDLSLFGQLLNQSHTSLKEDYEVTGIELDSLVAAAQAQAGTLGARMTGAGFGGCAIALVKEMDYDRFIKEVGAAYKEKIGYAASFYKAHIANGACKIE